jgi:hypothetical protein
MILDIIFVSAPWFHPCLSCGTFEIPGVNRSCNVKAGNHVYIGQSWGHWAVTKKEGVDTILPEVANCYQEVFVFGGLGQRQLQALSNAEGIPVLGPGTLIRKNSLVPISPACNWGQRPVLESILPLGGLG